MEGATCVGDEGGGDGNHKLVREQSISSHVNIPASTIALHTPESLSLTFIEVKGDDPS